MFRLSYIFPLSVLFFFQCKAILNVKVPPITITNAQTAAEKQMVGEDRELEKDGWVISSIQSSSNGQTNREKKLSNESDPDVKANRIRLDYLTIEEKKYKMHGMIGEGIGGILKPNPLAPTLPTYTLYENPAKKKRLMDVVSFINESRRLILEKELQLEKKKGKKDDDLLKIRQSLELEYSNSLSPGEYHEVTNGVWEKI
ncbi:MAG: DUF1318 domain-containing protein [Leptospira sp.]|nr:DUF1318 domain-containing protein [Leptospira sp.]